MDKDNFSRIGLGNLENNTLSFILSTSDDPGKDNSTSRLSALKNNSENLNVGLDNFSHISFESKFINCSSSEAPPLPPRPESHINSRFNDTGFLSEMKFPNSPYQGYKNRSRSIGKLVNIKSPLNIFQARNDFKSPKVLKKRTKSMRNSGEISFQHENHTELIFDQKSGFKLSQSNKNNQTSSFDKIGRLKSFSRSLSKFFRFSRIFTLMKIDSEPVPHLEDDKPIDSQREDTTLRKRHKSENQNISLKSFLTNKSSRGLPLYSHKEVRTAPTSPNDFSRCYRNCCDNLTTNQEGSVHHHHIHHHVYHVHHIHHYHHADKKGPNDKERDSPATNTSISKSIVDNSPHLYSTYQGTLDGQTSIINDFKGPEEGKTPKPNETGKINGLQRECSLDNCASITLERNPNQEAFDESIRQLKRCGWYWGPLKFGDAEHLLSNRPNGTFLVRDSGHDKNTLSLSFRVDDATYHTRIEYRDGQFSFWSQRESHSATNIIEFIHGAVEHSRSGKYHYFLQSAEAGRPPVEVPLLYPVSRHQTVQSLKQLCRFNIIMQSSELASTAKMDLNTFIGHLHLPPDLNEYLLERQYLFDNLDETEQQLRSKSPLLISKMEPFRTRNISLDESETGSLTPISRRSRLISSRPQDDVPFPMPNNNI